MSPPQPPHANDPIAAALVGCARFIRRHFLALLIVFVVSAAASMAYTLRLPNVYTATASILTQVPPPPIAGTSELLGEAARGSTPEAIAALYTQVARSRTVLTELLDMEHATGSLRSILAHESGLANPSDAELVADLARAFKLEVDPRTHSVHAAATHRDPVLAAALLTGLHDRVDSYIQRATDKGFGYTRDVLEMRREQVGQMLRLAEERLQTFERENPGRELSGALLARRDVLRVEVKSAADLYRSVSNQCDLARVAQQHYGSVVSILDRPTVPERKSGPPRGKIVIIAVGIAMLAAALYMRAHDVARRYSAAAAAGK